MTVVLEAREDFTLEAFRRVTVDGEDTVLGPVALQIMGAARAGFEQFLRSDPGGFIYGVTTRPGVEVGITIPLRNGAAGTDIARMQDMPGSAGVLEERLARERGACRVP
jgi:hypothetical protein